MIDICDICDPEWAEWYRMTPQQRWRESEKLWVTYLALVRCPHFLYQGL